MPKSQIVLLILFSMIFAFASGSEDSGKDVSSEKDRQINKMLSLKSSSPEQSLEMAEKLIREYPEEEKPYSIAATLYLIEKKYDRAEEVLRKAIDNVRDDEDFYLRLAHLYRRVNPSAFDSFIQQFREKEKERENFDLLLARILVIAGKRDNAISHLEKIVRDSPGRFEVLNLLVDLLRREGKKQEAQNHLVRSMESRDIPLNRRIDFFREYLETAGKWKETEGKLVTGTLVNLCREMSDYPECKKIIKDFILSVMQKGNLKALEQALAELKSDYSLLIRSRLYREMGNKEKRRELLKHYDGNIPLMLEEKARFLGEEDRYTSETISTWKKLISVKPENERIKLSFAQYLNRSDLKKRSLSVLDDIRMENLSPGFRRLYFALCFDALSDEERFRSIVDKWISASELFDDATLRVFSRGIFGNLPETYQHRNLLEQINKTLDSRSDQRHSLHFLKIHLAEQLRDFDLYFKMADQYIDGMSEFEPQIISDWAKKAISRGIRRIPGEKKQGPKLMVLNEQYLEYAEKWLMKLIRKRSNVPDYYGNLLYIYRAREKESEGIEKVVDMALEGSDNAERYHLAGYVLAKSGYPTEAIPYYERALELRPDIIRYKMNFGGCLIRNQQYERALELYRDVMTQDYTTHQWDMNEIIRQMAYCYEKLDKKEELLSLVRSMKDHPDIDRGELYLSAANVLSASDDFENTASLMKEYIAESKKSQKKFNAFLKLAETYVMQQNYDKAMEIYDQCRKTFKGDRKKVIDCIYNKGEMQRRKGDFEAALKTWKDLAESYPGDKGAQNALFSAASMVQRDMKNEKRALRLYREFLDLDPLDVNRLNAARNLVDQLKNKGAE